MTTYIKLSGLTCPACKKLTEKRISAVPGVNKVEVNINTGETVIESNREIEINIIKNALSGTPYQVYG